MSCSRRNLKRFQSYRSHWQTNRQTHQQTNRHTLLQTNAAENNATLHAIAAWLVSCVRIQTCAPQLRKIPYLVLLRKVEKKVILDPPRHGRGLGPSTGWVRNFHGWNGLGWVQLPEFIYFWLLSNWHFIVQLWLFSSSVLCSSMDLVHCIKLLLLLQWNRTRSTTEQ